MSSERPLRLALVCVLGLCLVFALGGRRRGGGTPPPPLLVYGVTPAEATVPTDQLYIQGRGFDVGSISVELEDPSDPGFVPPTVAVVDAKPHSLRVTIPSFSTNRREYRLVVRRNGNAAGATTAFSESIYLRASGSAPPSKAIRVQFVNWGWTFRCSDCGSWPDFFSKWEDGTTRRNSNASRTS
jgi:hypothetical protein